MYWFKLKIFLIRVYYFIEYFLTKDEKYTRIKIIERENTIQMYKNDKLDLIYFKNKIDNNEN